MSYFPITLIIVLGASMFVALIFLPVLGGMLGKPPPPRRSSMSARSRHRKRAIGARFPASPAGMRICPNASRNIPGG